MSENDEGADSVLAMLRQALSKSKETFNFEKRPVVGEKPAPEVQETVMPSTPTETLAPAAQEERASDVHLTAQPAPKKPRSLSAGQVQALIRQGLSQIPDFPERGVAVTVYGFRPWNAMLNFAPSSTSYKQAIAFREALTEIVHVLRTQVEVDINEDG